MRNRFSVTTISCLLAFAAGHLANADQPPASTTVVPPGTTPDGLVVDSDGLSDASIGDILIENGSIFDLDNPLENKTLYRLANRAHMTTRSDVIKRQLLFKSGDHFSLQALEESERLLRRNRYIQEVSITPVRNENGIVDINVATSDVWSLIPKLALSRSGGENKSAIGVQETNLLGTGMAIEVLYKSDFDRDSSSIKIADRNFAKSRYTLGALYALSSDGHSRFLNLSKPFYSLDSRNSRSVTFVDNDQLESFYDRGKKISGYRHELNKKEALVGWSEGLRNGWARRITTGLAYDENRFSATGNPGLAAAVVPADRKFLYPFIGIEMLEDKYDKTSNLDQIGRTEDRFLGTRMNARLGLTSASAGSDRDAWLFDAAAQTAFGSIHDDLLLLATGLGGRLEEDGVRNLILDVSARYYKRQSDRRLLFLELSGAYGNNLDLDQYFLLGGDNGLRGYPLRYQTGDRRALLTIEQRYFTDWYPFRLFRIGGAVFFDVGRAWGNAPMSSSENNDWLKDVGLGLRIGNTRSGLGRMTHIDLAFPLDGDNDIENVQLLISTKKSF
jgi:outer membrane protein assembly factor BamA